MDALLGNREQRKEKSANVTAADRARAAIEIVLPRISRRRPASPKTSGKETPRHRSYSRRARGAPAATIDPWAAASPVRSRLKSPSFGLAPIRTHGVRDGVDIRLIRSRRRRAYDIAGLPGAPDPPGGDAASRAQAVTPITTAPITAKTCRQGTDVMVRPERP